MDAYNEARRAGTGRLNDNSGETVKSVGNDARLGRLASLAAWERTGFRAWSCDARGYGLVEVVIRE